MYRPRIIPVLLLQNSGLVKSVNFKNHRYIGDPINAVRIFNDLKADELAFLDILATKEKRLISLEFVKKVGEEANMPFSVGGGIKSLRDIQQIIEVGAEKVILNSVVGENPEFVVQAVKEFGSSTITVCMDVKKDIFGNNKVNILAGKKSVNKSPLNYAIQVAEMGAGEIIIQSIDKDGTMNGYDIEMVKKISSNISIPVTVLGGAGKLKDMTDLLACISVNGLAAGSLFVYHGARNAVLINYPNHNEKLLILGKDSTSTLT